MIKAPLITVAVVSFLIKFEVNNPLSHFYYNLDHGI